MNHDIGASTFFDRVARWYDAGIMRWVYFEHLYRRVLRVFDMHGAGLASQGAVIVDVACGTGEMLRRFSTRFPQSQYVGVDLSAMMLGVARKKLPENIQLIQAPAHRIPMEDGRADIIFSTEAFHHFDRPEHALKEWYRMLKPGGLLFFVDPYFDSPIVRRFLMATFGRWEEAHAYYSQGEYERMIIASGFRVMHKQTFLHNVFILGDKPHQSNH